MKKIFIKIWQFFLKIWNFITGLFKKRKKKLLERKLAEIETAKLTAQEVQAPEITISPEEQIFLDLIGRGYPIQVVKNEIGYIQEEIVEGVIGVKTGNKIYVDLYQTGNPIETDEVLPKRVRVRRQYIYEPYIEDYNAGIPYIPCLVVKEIKYLIEEI